MKKRIDRAAAALARIIPTLGSVASRTKDTREVLKDFASRVERHREQRLSGNGYRLPYERCSLSDLAQIWAGFYAPGEVSPADLTRALDARVGGRDESGRLMVISVALLARRFRELARQGQQDRFHEPLAPTKAELEALVAEFNAATEEAPEVAQ